MNWRIDQFRRSRAYGVLKHTLRFAVAAPLVVVTGFFAAVHLLPYDDHWEAPPPSGTWLEDRSGQPLAAFVASNDQWHLPLTHEQISPHLLKAMIAAEDHRFYEHSGVDWRSVLSAVRENATSLRIRRGASTITMQVQRLRDHGSRSFAYKVLQAVRATQLERRLTKQQILDEYINRAPFGGNLVGAGAASWRYFGRPCRELSLSQAALIAGVPQNPRHFRPDRFKDKAQARRDRVLSRMLALRLITPDEHRRAIDEPIDAAWRPLPQMARNDGLLPTAAWIARRKGTGVVRCTIDSAIQQQVAAAARQQLEHLRTSGVSALAIVVLDTATAECLAAASIADTAPDVDLTRRARSTGSALKPFIYAAAFDAGIAAPATLLNDSPTAWPGYVPANYDRTFRGRITAADALAESRNIPALVLLSHIGPARASATMGAAGLRHQAARPQRYGLSLAIGGAEATAQELAEAYATLARGGIPRALILSGERQVEGSSPIFRSASCYQALAALSRPERTATICTEAVALHPAWKTGTSSGHRDAWCAAVTHQRTVVVWLGNPKGQGAISLVGQQAAAPLALRLLAGLCNQPAPWLGDEPQPDESQLVRSPARPKLALLSPVDGLQVLYNPDIPANRQHLLLRAAAASQPETTLWWFVDGRPVGTSVGDGKLFWPPSPGRHVVRVIDAQGRTAVAKVTVAE